MFECVINVSEGTDLDLLDVLRRSCATSCRDLHHDAFHNRSVFTLINSEAELVSDVRQLLTTAFSLLDLSTHHGVHPRLGVVDVVPFVALHEEDQPKAVALRDEMAAWISETFEVPTFLYGTAAPTLPALRKGAFATIAPSFGPPVAHPKWGAVCVGDRPVLLAWNIWLEGVSLSEAKAIAADIRQLGVRALGLPTGDFVQVSCNLTDPRHVGPGRVFDQVAGLLPATGRIHHCELVGLAPAEVLSNEDPQRWSLLGLDRAHTIEGRTA